jgi:hypothetical protein
VATTRTRSTRSTALARAFPPETSELDARIDEAVADAIVMWRREPIALAGLPERIARIDDRGERDGLYAGWIEALEAINPLYEARFDRWREAATAAGASDVPAAAAAGRDLEALALDVEQLAIGSETVYHAALRRYLALIDIEQGDATLADMWHVVRGAAWSHWFGPRELSRAAADAGRSVAETDGDGWRAAERELAGADAGGATPAAALAELYGGLVGDPTWLERALRLPIGEAASFADFAGLVRLWRLRRALALTQYELRLYRSDNPEIARAYYAGIVGHTTGIIVPEAAYLHDVGTPLSSVAELERSMLAGAMAETVEARFGSAWWSDESARAWLAGIGATTTTGDALAQLGYDALDWRPVLRQIRTRLIGEMSGYGGPNITTRAGTRKV